jgi:hypothetical protein
MTHSADQAYWRELEANAHLPEIQELIRQEIQSGTIRVRPNGDGGIRVVPIFISEDGEQVELELAPAPPQDDPAASKRGALHGRITRR